MMARAYLGEQDPIGRTDVLHIHTERLLHQLSSNALAPSCFLELARARQAGLMADTWLMQAKMSLLVTEH